MICSVNVDLQLLSSELSIWFVEFIWPKLLADKKKDGISRVERDADNQQLMQLEEKDVVSSVANVLSDLCGPGEWMPMEKLHAEVTSNLKISSHKDQNIINLRLNYKHMEKFCL